MHACGRQTKLKALEAYAKDGVYGYSEADIERERREIEDELEELNGRPLSPSSSSSSLSVASSS